MLSFYITCGQESRMSLESTDRTEVSATFERKIQEVVSEDDSIMSL